MVKLLRRTIVIGVLVLAGMLAPRAEKPQAQQAAIAVPPSVRTAAMWFGPLPVPRLFEPEVIEQIEQMELDSRWPMPHEGTAFAWATDAGRLSVETRQIDELWHTTARGETKHRLREMYGGRLDRIIELNPGVDFDDLQEGQKVLVWQRDPEKVSQSVGPANRGRLYFGEPLPPGENYKILYHHRTFGTYYTVSEIVRVMDAFKKRFPEAHPLMIGDISFRTGRMIRPHRSHQSGRDVDISYPRRDGGPPNYRRFHNVRSSLLDAERALWLLKSFIDGGQVEYIFVDRYLQRALVEEARRQGAPEDWIEAVFQYPHWSGGHAIIRHARGHRNHFHIRFKCQESDRRCR